MERVGLIYNNKVRLYTVISIIMWTTLAILLLLGIFVISPARNYYFCKYWYRDSQTYC
ncbi:hypothetical protein C2G38_2115286 [Gigaspora rosea]|uniref:Uncharacterized protein n=1 Tax=Gigaspora rosea TaxID=44941 RepID=A0A397UHH9_9GLOM|nr:hypothetical protein C2G38_2115286 [Gigaspora rosea]